MRETHAKEVVSCVYDYLERFNYIKELLSIGFKEMGDFYEMDLLEVEMLISFVHYNHTFISSGVGNQNFFIADQDYDTILKVFFELADAEMIEIQTSNVDRENDTFYYQFEVTPKGEFIYEDFMEKFDFILEIYERNMDQLTDSYGQSVDHLEVLLDDLRYMTHPKNIQGVHEAFLKAFEEEHGSVEELLDEEDPFDDQYDGFKYDVASAYQIMLIQYSEAIMTKYDNVKIGLIDPVDGGDIVVKTMVEIDGEFVRKDFLFEGNDTTLFTEIDVDDENNFTL